MLHVLFLTMLLLLINGLQRQAVPAIMSGRDVIGVAKTGSGKTLAYLVPMFRHIMDQPPLAEGEGPIALIMAPARELAIQVRACPGRGVVRAVLRRLLVAWLD